MQPRRLIALTTCVLAACALGAGCLSDREAVRTLRKDDPRAQTAMIARVAREKKTSMTGDLVRLLEDDDEGVRFMAATALHKLTGIDRGIHFAEGEKRKAIVAEWHRWYEAETGKPVPDFPLEAPPPGEETDAIPAEDRVDGSAVPAEPSPGDETPQDATDGADEGAGATDEDETDAESPEAGAAPAEAKETAE